MEGENEGERKRGGIERGKERGRETERERERGSVGRVIERGKEGGERGSMGWQSHERTTLVFQEGGPRKLPLSTRHPNAPPDVSQDRITLGPVSPLARDYGGENYYLTPNRGPVFPTFFCLPAQSTDSGTVTFCGL